MSRNLEWEVRFTFLRVVALVRRHHSAVFATSPRLLPILSPLFTFPISKSLTCHRYLVRHLSSHGFYMVPVHYFPLPVCFVLFAYLHGILYTVSHLMCLLHVYVCLIANNFLLFGRSTISESI
jgi:hypothetical protein